MEKLWIRFYSTISVAVLCMAVMTGCSAQTNDNDAQGEESPVVETTETGSPSDSLDATPAGETPDVGETTPAGEGSDAVETASAVQSPDAAEKTAGGSDGTKKNNTDRTKETGNTVSERNQDKKKDSVTNQRDQQKKDAASVTMKRAKEIALKKAGLSEKDGNWTKEEVDRDHGKNVYELEFVSGNMEYDFEIDTKSGKILEYEKDLVND